MCAVCLCRQTDWTSQNTENRHSYENWGSWKVQLESTQSWTQWTHLGLKLRRRFSSLSDTREGRAIRQDAHLGIRFDVFRGSKWLDTTSCWLSETNGWGNREKRVEKQTIIAWELCSCCTKCRGEETTEEVNKTGKTDVIASGKLLLLNTFCECLQTTMSVRNELHVVSVAPLMAILSFQLAKRVQLDKTCGTPFDRTKTS